MPARGSLCGRHHQRSAPAWSHARPGQSPARPGPFPRTKDQTTPCRERKPAFTRYYEAKTVSPIPALHAIWLKNVQRFNVLNVLDITVMCTKRPLPAHALFSLPLVPL